MWFGLLDREKADKMIDELAKPAHQTDWGMRIIGNDSAKYSAGGYHFGAVWPLFTGWASVAEYKYHRAAPAYANLRANALLALDGSLGHTTEVLSGDYYSSLSTSSPHQIWSAAMVINPILRGMLGLSTDAATQTITFAPHAPANWITFDVKNVQAGTCVVDLFYLTVLDAIELRIDRKVAPDAASTDKSCTINFSPSVSARASVGGVTIGHDFVPIHVEANANDQHVVTHVALRPGRNFITIGLLNDFAISYSSELPLLGTASQSLHILSETWTEARDRLTLSVSGIAGQQYLFDVHGVTQITSIDGAELLNNGTQIGQIRLRMPDGAPNAFVNAAITIHFAARQSFPKSSKKPASAKSRSSQ
jgi:hypothetical protein